jgi:tRNA-dihydrouridine synthase C
MLNKTIQSINPSEASEGEILLAPMEGLLDFVLRDVLTRVGGIDRCVSEFIRITDTLLPERVFFREIPELLNGGHTSAGVPVRGQLLGSDPVCLAENAARLASLSNTGVDLNFGCPAKVVNRHGGGATLLQYPEQLFAIAQAVRRAVPKKITVSAKMRLGYSDDQRAEECALALEAGGIDELVVHARTKADGYRPPAYWERIADIKSVVRIPVIANGEIWNIQDAKRCVQLSGCQTLMVGRGMVTYPGLALAIKKETSGLVCMQTEWNSLKPLIQVFWNIVSTRLDRKQQAGRVKQWFNFLRRRYVQAEDAYQELRTVDDPLLIDQWIAKA